MYVCMYVCTYACTYVCIHVLDVSIYIYIAALRKFDTF